MVHRKIRRYSYLKKMKMNKKDSSFILMQKINFYYVKYFSYAFIINDITDYRKKRIILSGRKGC